jgi:hypothetical protein
VKDAQVFVGAVLGHAACRFLSKKEEKWLIFNYSFILCRKSGYRGV